LFGWVAFGPLAAFEEKPLLLGGDAGVPAHERAHLPRVLCVHPRLEVGPEEGGGRGDWVVGVAGTVGGEIGNGWNLRRKQAALDGAWWLRGTEGRRGTRGKARTTAAAGELVGVGIV
jgi:hypothetical protein